MHGARLRPEHCQVLACISIEKRIRNQALTGKGDNEFFKGIIDDYLQSRMKLKKKFDKERLIENRFQTNRNNLEDTIGKRLNIQTNG